MIAGTIKRHIYAGQVLLTPGRGLPAVNQNQFTIAKVDDSRIVFEFPSGPIFVRHSEIDHAIRETRKAGGRVRIGAAQGWADSGTLQRFPQDAKGNTFANRKLRSPGTRGVWRGGIYDGRQSERSACRRRIDKYMIAKGARGPCTISEPLRRSHV